MGVPTANAIAVKLANETGIGGYLMNTYWPRLAPTTM